MLKIGKRRKEEHHNKNSLLRLKEKSSQIAHLLAGPTFSRRLLPLYVQNLHLTAIKFYP
jgi:hypothetical protein